MNTRIRSLFGVLFALLFIAVVPTKAQHYTHDDVNTIIAENHGGGRYLPQIFQDAQILGVGLTVDGDGGVTLDDQYGYGSLASDDYFTIMYVTGDPLLAIEGSAGLLSPAELARARGEDPFYFEGGVHGSWGTLSTFYGSYGFSYSGVFDPGSGGGGGGYQN